MNSKWISIVLLTTFACACAKEQAPEDKTDERCPSRVTVSLGETFKTSLQSPDGGIYPVVWSAGDRISINGVTSDALTASEAGRQAVPFHFDGDLFLPFNTLYPASSQSDAVRFSPSQRYSAGSFADGAAPMWGAADEFADVSLHHLSAALKFPFRAGGDGQGVTRVLVSALGGEALCGTFRMELSEKGLFTGAMTATEDGASTVELDCGEGVSLSPSQATDFFVCIPSGTYAKGFKVTVIDNGGKAMTLYFLTDAGPALLAPGKVLEFPEKAVSATESVLTVSSVGDLQQFAANAASYKKVVLLNDITWPEESVWTPVNGFTGELDGGMHVIAGLKAPLLNQANGCIVRNLVLDSDITTLSAGYIASLACTAGNSARFVNCHSKGSIRIGSATFTNAGGLVAVVSGSETRLNGCSYSGDIEIVSNSTGSVYCGGLAGKVDAGHIENCRFAGQLSLDGNTGNLFMGGIAGRNDSPSGIRSCSNTGSISTLESITATGMCFLGGIAGFIKNDADDCTHSGSFLCQGTSMNSLVLGGLCGVCRGTAAGCVNDGAVTLSVAGLPSYAYVGGLIGNMDYTKTLDGLSSTENAIITIQAPVTAQVISAGGIVGNNNLNDLTLSNCVNKGSLLAYNACPMYTTGLLMGGIIGSSVRSAATKLTLEGCRNEGRIHLEEERQSSNYVYAGGIIGLAGNTDKTLTLIIDACTNSGEITRHVNNMAYQSDRRAFCGGICGAVGGDNRGVISGTTAYNYDVNAKISGCINSGTLRFNRFVTTTSFKENNSVDSYTGGIAGVTKSVGSEKIVISCCENRGDILSTAGYNGGIVGFVRSGTVIRGEKLADGVHYTRNRGTIGMFDVNSNNETGSGYMYSGGIAGRLDSEKGDNRIEYCWNDGYVAAATNGSVGAGGIVGYLNIDDAVRYCKNSGTVRFKSSSSVATSSAVYTGQISGSKSDFKVRDCAVGGLYGRKGGATAGLDNIGGDERYVFSKFIYAMTDNITTQVQIDILAPGCVWWNGVDTLDWEH